MKVNILYFSSIKDKLKKTNETIEIKEGFTVNDLLNELKSIHPEISDSLDNVMVAVNEEYKDKNYTLKNNDTVAIIPPVSGG